MASIIIIICILLNALVLRKMIKARNKQGICMGILIIGMCVTCLVSSLLS